jgi:hypothetical protein
MERRRRDQVILGALLFVLAVVGYRAWRSTAIGPGAASKAKVAGRQAKAPTARLTAPDVHLEALDASAPAPEPGGRDLFTFGRPRASAAPSPAAPPPPVTTFTPRETPASRPDGTAPIPLKFIGIVGPQQSTERIAVLSDGRGMPFWGREGDAIAGRYRILHIGAESIEMAYLDGRGRQTLRLSGS